MVRLSILCPPSPDEYKKDPTRNQALSVSDLWPALPVDGSVSLGDYRVRNLTDQWLPISTCIFGGIDGHLLPHLDQVTIWTADETSSGNLDFSTDVHALHPPIHALQYIHALQFHLKQPVEGRHSIALGRIPRPFTKGIESQDISLDSEHGERITGIDVIYAALGDILGIRVSICRQCQRPWLLATN